MFVSWRYCSYWDEVVTQELARQVQKILTMEESAVNESNVKVAVRVRPMNRRGECEPQPCDRHITCLMFRSCVFDSGLYLRHLFLL